MTKEQKIEKLEEQIKVLKNRKNQILQQEKRNNRKLLNHAKFIMAGIILKDWKGKPEKIDELIKKCTSEKDKAVVAVLKSLL